MLIGAELVVRRANPSSNPRQGQTITACGIQSTVFESDARQTIV
jgi:hypothetical protein